MLLFYQEFLHEIEEDTEVYGTAEPSTLRLSYQLDSEQSTAMKIRRQMGVLNVFPNVNKKIMLKPPITPSEKCPRGHVWNVDNPVVIDQAYICESKCNCMLLSKICIMLNLQSNALI